MATAKKKTTSKTKGAKAKNTKKPASATATKIEQMQEPQVVATAGKKQMRAILMFAVAVFLMFVALISSPEKNLWNFLQTI